MMTYHQIDSFTLMKAIELLDKYSWSLTTKDCSASTDEREYLAMTLRSLRNAMKADLPHKPIC